jgi:hypothetical protein
MPQAVVTVATIAVTFLSASCLNIKDVVQPAEVEAGEKFEVSVELRSYAGLKDVKGLAFAGVAAVSIPEGAEVLKATYEGAAKGRLDERAAVGPDDLPERPGYSWVYLVTPEMYDPIEYAGKDYVVTLVMRAPPAPGDYRLGYAAGAVWAESSDIDYAHAYWGNPWMGEGREPVLERGITVK